MFIVFSGINGNGRDGLSINNRRTIEYHPIVVPSSQSTVGAADTFVTSIQIPMVYHTAGSGSRPSTTGAIDFYAMNRNSIYGNVCFL